MCRKNRKNRLLSRVISSWSWIHQSQSRQQSYRQEARIRLCRTWSQGPHYAKMGISTPISLILSHTFNKYGVRPPQSKVQAIQTPLPKSRKQLRPLIERILFFPLFSKKMCLHIEGTLKARSQQAEDIAEMIRKGHYYSAILYCFITSNKRAIVHTQWIRFFPCLIPSRIEERAGKTGERVTM